MGELRAESGVPRTGGGHGDGDAEGGIVLGDRDGGLLRGKVAAP